MSPVVGWLVAALVLTALVALGSAFLGELHADDEDDADKADFAAWSSAMRAVPDSVAGGMTSNRLPPTPQTTTERTQQ